MTGDDFYGAYAKFTPNKERMVYFASTEPVYHTTCLELKEINFEEIGQTRVIVPKIESPKEDFSGFYGF